MQWEGVLTPPAVGPEMNSVFPKNHLLEGTGVSEGLSTQGRNGTVDHIQPVCLVPTVRRGVSVPSPK